MTTTPQLGNAIRRSSRFPQRRSSLRKKMSNLKKPIDFKMLENELDRALRADELYKLQNDAKLRAIEQRVPSYDHFRDMVQAAHLRPLERSEMQKKADVSWNHCYSKSDDEEILKIYGPPNDGRCDNVFESTEPQNSAEFLKNWKNLSDHSHKLEYLLRFRKGLREKFFKVEVPSEFLEEFFKLSLDVCSPDVFLEVVEILRIFTECNRFALSLAMISESGKNCLQLLFENFAAFARNSAETETVERLMSKYCVSL